MPSFPKAPFPGAGISRKLDARTSAWFRTLTLLVLLIAAAVVSEVFLHARVDLTRGGDFTLPPAALRALELNEKTGLPDNVTVRVVMSKDLPPEFARIRTRLVDVLGEFAARSQGRLELVFQDPGETDDPDSSKRVAALSLGIEEIVFQEKGRNGVKAKKGFFGLALLYRDKKETFPVLRDVETFEYDLIVRLRRLTGAVKTICLVESPGNPLQFSILKARIEPLYRLKRQDLMDPSSAAGVDLLLVAAPTHLNETEKIRIDQYVMTGKPVIFLTPGINVDLSAGIEATPTQNGYEDLLAHYGFNVHKQLLIEPENWEKVRFGDAEFPIPYPYWIAVPYNNLNADNPVTASLHALSFPWTSALEIDSAAQPGARFETLAATSDWSWESWWEEVHRVTLYPRPLNAYTPTVRHSYPLVVSATGPMTPFYPSAPMPRSRDARKGNVRLLVISNALFVSDLYADYIDIENNLQLVLGALDQLALDPGLIAVRSRQLTDIPLDENRTERTKPLILGLNMLVSPLLVLVLAGLFAFYRRNNRRNRIRKGRVA